MGFAAGKFSKKSYENNDDLGKKILKKFLVEKRGHKIISDDTENYMHDVVTEKNGKIYHFEVEMKRNYPFLDVNDYPFPSVSFLSRKKRLHLNQEYEYIIICYETTHAVGCNSNIIFKDDYQEDLMIDKYERTGHDQFYRVPKNLCYFFKLN